LSTFIDGNLDRSRALYLLVMQDAAYRGMADNWPRPRWCKFRSDSDHLFVLAWMNRACADRFYTHCDPRRVIGHCDRVCWSDENSAKYAATDEEAVRRAGEIVECHEPTQNGLVRVTKFAFRSNSPDLSGWFVYGECPDE
jgi:hypothetical protein